MSSVLFYCAISSAACYTLNVCITVLPPFLPFASLTYNEEETAAAYLVLSLTAFTYLWVYKLPKISPRFLIYPHTRDAQSTVVHNGLYHVEYQYHSGDMPTSLRPQAFSLIYPYTVLSSMKVLFSFSIYLRPSLFLYLLIYFTSRNKKAVLKMRYNSIWYR